MKICLKSSLVHLLYLFYGLVKAGYDLLAEENFIGYVETDLKNTDECFALKVVGSSMEPVLFEDDIVIVRKQNSVEDGQIAVVIVDDEATVKKIHLLNDGIELIAYNSYYPPRKVKDFIIVGRVIEARIKKIFE